jgi:peptidoglycan/LPS O-acetylase OafA/YrhL
MADLPAGRRFIEWLCRPSVFIVATVLLLASFLVRGDYFQNTWRFTIQSILLLPIIAGVIFAERFSIINRLLNSAALVWIGALSYSLYVWHGGAIFLFEPWLEHLPAVVLPIMELLVSFILACLSYYIVERPVMRLRKYFIAGISRKPGTAAPDKPLSSAA